MSRAQSIKAEPARQLSLQLDRLTRCCLDDSLFRESLLCKGRLSIQKVCEAIGLEASNALKHQFAACPPLNRAYRSLKYAAEGFGMSFDEIDGEVGPLVEAVTRLGEQFNGQWTRSALKERDSELYEQITSSAYAKIVLARARLSGRAEYWYWSDEDFIRAADEYESWSHMQQKESRLRAHIDGRLLREAVIRAHPKFASHMRIGLDGFCYHSFPELVIGNWLAVNRARVIRQHSTGVSRKVGGRQMVADFYLCEIDLLLEVTQTDEIENSGEKETPQHSRRKVYCIRLTSKLHAYERAGLKCFVANSEPFYSGGQLDAVGFAEFVRAQLKERYGVDVGPVPEKHLLLWEDVPAKKSLLEGPIERVLAQLRKNGVRGVGDFQNRHSSLYRLLSIRPDFDLLLTNLKSMTAARVRSNRERQRIQRDERFAPLSEVRELCHSEKISTQTEWFEFAKRNKETLKAANIPVSVHTIYKRLGQWKNWRDVLAPRNPARKLPRRRIMSLFRSAPCSSGEDWDMLLREVARVVSQFGARLAAHTSVHLEDA